MNKYKKSFTLIELLVVITIIGILSTVVLINLSGVRARARDARRISDLNQIKTALESFYNDYGKYPPHSSDGRIDGAWTVATDIDSILSNYMQGKPKDPLHDGVNYFLYYSSNFDCGGAIGRKAKICIFKLETDKYKNNPTACPNSGCDYNFVLGEGSS